MIVIRADANSKIGMGHVMRCLSVAERLRRMGERVCFLTADESAVALLQDRRYEVRVLHTDYSHMEEETQSLLEALKELSPHTVLIDSYFVTKRYLEELRRHVRTAYLDDMYAFSYPVDLLINYNLYGTELGYREDASLKGTKLLLGPDYAPVRDEFTNVAYRVKEQAARVLISTGGSDTYNIAGQLLEEFFRQGSELCFEVVSGAMNPHLSDLNHLAEEHGNITIHSNVRNMAELMKECDVAISAGGSTMYELGAVGVPTLCFSFVDNQERLAESFGKKGFAAYMGNYLVDGRQLIRNICTETARLAENFEARLNLSRRARGLVDGLGAERIANELQKEDCNEENKELEP